MNSRAYNQKIMAILYYVFSLVFIGIAIRGFIVGDKRSVMFLFLACSFISLGTLIIVQYKKEKKYYEEHKDEIEKSTEEVEEEQK